jgi:threonine dehydrogenase-like Zn-dependent dehydrogenase
MRALTWQGNLDVRVTDVPAGGTLAVLGLGPIGQFAGRIAGHLGAERVIGVVRGKADGCLKVVLRPGA